MIRVTICGDFCPEDRVQKLIESGNYDSVFGEIKRHTSAADLNIINLEAPVLLGEGKPIEKCGPNLKCSYKAVEAIKSAGFNLATLANNHFYDYGEQGVYDTIETCLKHQIDTVGGGKNIEEASKIYYKEIKDRKIAIINCCEREFSIATEGHGGSNPLNPVQQYYSIKKAKENSDYVIVITHGGHEHYNLPSPRMKETYRFFIDAGADAVINHHQHCNSGYEEYNNKPIFYGIGNFCFDRHTKRNSLWNKGYMVCLNLSEEKIGFDIVPYVQGDELPGVSINKVNKDAFLASIKEINEKISNDAMLSEEHKSFMNKQMKWFKLIFEPYKNRFLRALYLRGLLPSFMGHARRMNILNYFRCESHRETSMNAFEHK